MGGALGGLGWSRFLGRDDDRRFWCGIFLILIFSERVSRCGRK
jgi:hypothetical protein